MLTETEARDLLAQAADTIDVRLTAPAGRQGPRLRPALAAAALVAAIALGTWLVGGPGEAPSPAPTGPAATTASPSGGTDDPGDPNPDGENISLSELQARLEALSSAAAFRAFAEGKRETAPFADRVRLYVGNEPQKTIGAAELRDRSSWQVCAPYAEVSCPFSAIEVVRGSEDRPVPATRLRDDRCLDTLAPTPTDTGGATTAVLSGPGRDSCADAWAVVLSTTADGTITAVNLLLGSP